MGILFGRKGKQKMCDSMAEISIRKLKNNILEIRNRLDGHTKLAAVLKADAYGHGAKEMASIIEKHGLADMLVFGKLEELRDVLEDTYFLPLLVLGYSSIMEIGKYMKFVWFERVVLSAYDIKYLRRLQKSAQICGVKARVHIRIDINNSGMGFSVEEFGRYQKEIFSYSDIKVEGLYAHFYSSYRQEKDKLEGELKEFHSFVCGLEPLLRKKLLIHIENSPLLFHYPQYQYDMVRIGTAMYGLPFDRKNYNLQPLLCIRGRIFAINEVKDIASYKESSERGIRKVAIIMFGYWDCPFLMTQKNIKVKIKGRLYPVLDEACMDNVCVDITGSTDVIIGDEAVFLGEEGVDVRDILERTGVDLVHSEYFCMTSGRLLKHYVG